MTKITISGTPPQYSQEELEQLQQRKVQTFLKTTQSMHQIHASLPNALLKLFGEKVEEGYSLSDLPISMAPGAYSAYLHKPDSVLEPEVEAIRVQVKAEYVAHLQSEHNRYKELLVKQLMEAEEEKEAKEAAERKAKQLADFQRQADDCYKPLEIPE